MIGSDPAHERRAHIVDQVGAAVLSRRERPAARTVALEGWEIAVAHLGQGAQPLVDRVLVVRLEEARLPLNPPRRAGDTALLLVEVRDFVRGGRGYILKLEFERGILRVPDAALTDCRRIGGAHALDGAAGFGDDRAGETEVGVVDGAVAL